MQANGQRREIRCWGGRFRSFGSLHFKTPFEVLIDPEARSVAWVFRHSPPLVEVVRKENLGLALGNQDVSRADLLNHIGRQLDKCGRDWKRPAQSVRITHCGFAL